VETQKLLLADVNTNGSFLVRESESVPNTYALSLRETDTVRHYKIKRLDNGGYYISKNREFDSLQSMVAFYLQEPEGLCCKLASPCKKVRLHEKAFNFYFTKFRFSIILRREKDGMQLRFKRRTFHVSNVMLVRYKFFI
jgi:hypothetical protein